MFSNVSAFCCRTLLIHRCYADDRGINELFGILCAVACSLLPLEKEVSNLDCVWYFLEVEHVIIRAQGSQQESLIVR
jgi:hypothetical protein